MNYVVYRHFDKNNNLLYIGCTQNIFNRTMAYQHQHRDWFREIVNITLEHFDSKESAFEAEAQYIISEKTRAQP